jgi:hypothetical protein
MVGSKGIYIDGNKTGSMNLNLRYSIMMALVITIVIIAGCIVPTKDTKATPTPTPGIDYLVPGSGGTQGGPSQSQAQGTNPQVTRTGPTMTPLPQDTRYLTPVNPYSTLNSESPDYRTIVNLPEPTQSPPSYMEIYNNTLPLMGYAVGYEYYLVNAPLIIHFDVQPKMVDRTIWYESPSGALSGPENHLSRSDVITTTTQPSPNAWFEITVRDKNTRNVILDEGYGRTFGSDLVKNVTVRYSGNYQIDMQGNDVNVTVNMYIRNTT